MSISTIKNDEIPYDKKFIKLFKNVVTGQLPCFEARIKTEGIWPYHNYIAKVDQAYKNYVLDKLDNGQVPVLHVYPEDGPDGFFILSDDHNLFAIYLQLQIDEMPCYVLGAEPSGRFVVEKKKIVYPNVPEIITLPSSS